MGRKDYDEKDAAKETGAGRREAERAWEQAKKDDWGGSSGQTVNDVAPPDSGEEVSAEDIAEAEESQNE